MYIIPRARPWPGINRKRSPFPHFSSCVSAFSCLKLMSVTNSQPCRWSHAGLTRIASLCLAPLSHPHTHTLSLSPSLSGSGITTTHTAPRPAQRAFSFRGRRSVYLILSHFRTRARTPTPQYSPIMCQWHTNKLGHAQVARRSVRRLQPIPKIISLP